MNEHGKTEHGGSHGKSDMHISLGLDGDNTIRRGIVVDTARCMACYNCFSACKDEHCGFETPVSAPQPHTGHSWMRIDSKERGNDSRKVKTSDVATPCVHCQNAPCELSGSNGAVYTRPDGIVIIDPEKAKGQRKIMDACPIGAVYWNSELDIPQKCTMCAHLLDEGYEMPRCVEACPNGALSFGNLSDPDSRVNEFVRQGRVSPLSGLERIETNVVHLNIPTVFAAGSVYLPDDEPADGARITLTSIATNETRTASTNYFGDWEFEWLEKGAEYSLDISFDGYIKVNLTFTADTDRYLGEVTLNNLIPNS